MQLDRHCYTFSIRLLPNERCSNWPAECGSTLLHVMADERSLCLDIPVSLVADESCGRWCTTLIACILCCGAMKPRCLVRQQDAMHAANLGPNSPCTASIVRRKPRFARSREDLRGGLCWTVNEAAGAAAVGGCMQRS